MKKKNSWFWNLVIILTVIGCGFAFVLHYKNWTNIEDDTFKITSGIYSQKIPLSQINEVTFVAKLPEMERKNGFSWLAKEKGIFKDSISGHTTYVFVDDLRQQKIRLTHTDSLLLFFNLADSLETTKFYEEIHLKISATE